MQTNQRLDEQEHIQRCGWPQCQAACCIYGAWVETPLVDQILVHAPEISALLPPTQQNPHLWFDEQVEADPHVPGKQVRPTQIIPDPAHYGGQKCIFLRPDAKCALQVFSETQGDDPWRYKPFYCILHPLMLDPDGAITLDAVDVMEDETASCVREANTPIQLTTLFAEELSYLNNNRKG